MIAYWQLTQNGWTCSVVEAGYRYSEKDMVVAWLYKFSRFFGAFQDAMRYYPA